MELNYFKDILFDLINECDEDIRDIIADDKKNFFRVIMGDGSVFCIHCEQVSCLPPSGKNQRFLPEGETLLANTII